MLYKVLIINTFIGTAIFMFGSLADLILYPRPPCPCPDPHNWALSVLNVGVYILIGSGTVVMLLIALDGKKG